MTNNEIKLLLEKVEKLDKFKFNEIRFITYRDIVCLIRDFQNNE